MVGKLIVDLPTEEKIKFSRRKINRFSELVWEVYFKQDESNFTLVERIHKHDEDVLIDWIISCFHSIDTYDYFDKPVEHFKKCIQLTDKVVHYYCFLIDRGINIFEQLDKDRKRFDQGKKSGFEKWLAFYYEKQKT